MRIGTYETVLPFQTAASGNARWCVAKKNNKKYFLKQFLAPVQPVQTTETPTKQVLLRRRKCAAFENRKLRLYDELRQLPAELIVHVEDFFVHDGHYYAASEYLGSSYQTFETYRTAQLQAKLMLLLSFAQCLQAVHGRGVVHADLKPEHIVVEHQRDTLRVRLIDFDSGFLETLPPDVKSGMDADPVYLSPETYLLISGKNVKLDRKLDTFAFGLLAYQLLAGDLPGFDRAKYSYPYAAVLDGSKLAFSKNLDDGLQALIRKMLRNKPALRPADNTVCAILSAMVE
ncbi:MAG: protein kinase [Clostridiales bacterium]|nr:protein kinase [Clostridiales bacterium]